MLNKKKGSIGAFEGLAIILVIMMVIAVAKYILCEFVVNMVEGNIVKVNIREVAKMGNEIKLFFSIGIRILLFVGVVLLPIFLKIWNGSDNKDDKVDMVQIWITISLLITTLATILIMWFGIDLFYLKKEYRENQEIISESEMPIYKFKTDISEGDNKYNVYTIKENEKFINKKANINKSNYIPSTENKVIEKEVLTTYEERKVLKNDNGSKLSELIKDIYSTEWSEGKYTSSKKDIIYDFYLDKEYMKAVLD